LQFLNRSDNRAVEHCNQTYLQKTEVKLGGDFALAHWVKARGELKGNPCRILLITADAQTFVMNRAYLGVLALRRRRFAR
jgi:hypothetical protein